MRLLGVASMWRHSSSLVCLVLVGMLVCPRLVGPGWAGGSGKKAAKAYPFAVGPREAFGVLADLAKISGHEEANSLDETRLFADVAAGKGAAWSFAEVALIASGATDADKRKEHLKRLDDIEAQARATLPGAKTTRERGDKLLRLLHAGPMSGGYEARQTSLAELLDAKKYNCVSSAVLYNVIGQRFDLDLKAIDIPSTGYLAGHVFSILRTDGVVIDVETTNKEGFNIKGKRERPDGVSYDPKANKEYKHEVGNLGLAAVVYYNRGVELSKEKKYHAAIVMNFRALCLDPDNKSAIQNALADLGNWGPKLSKEGNYEEGLHVLAIGLKLAPDASVMKNNRQVVWTEYAHATMAAGKDDEALAVAARAAAVLMDRASERLPADLYLAPGEKLARDGKWEEAFALVERGLPKVTGQPAKELRDWRAGLYLRWSSECQRRKDWDGAFAVLDKARADNPKDDRYRGNTVFLVQERLRDEGAREQVGLAPRGRRADVHVEVHADALEERLGHQHRPQLDRDLQILQLAQRRQELHDFFLHLLLLVDDEGHARREILDRPLPAKFFPRVLGDHIHDQPLEHCRHRFGRAVPRRRIGAAHLSRRMAVGCAVRAERAAEPIAGRAGADGHAAAIGRIAAAAHRHAVPAVVHLRRHEDALHHLHRAEHVRHRIALRQNHQIADRIGDALKLGRPLFLGSDDQHFVFDGVGEPRRLEQVVQRGLHRDFLDRAGERGIEVDPRILQG